VDRKELVVPEERFIEACGVMKSDPATIDLSEAEIVVSVGRGMGSAENVRLAHQLAEALGGVLAGTRVAVDLGWLPKARQVGQTGKTIQPRLYIACGLSGATQHTMGMKQSDNIINQHRSRGAHFQDRRSLYRGGRGRVVAVPR
jgi:electron transfer flavoprotein alpha subunit